MTVHVLGVPFTVRTVATIDAGKDGLCDWEKALIILRPGLAPGIRRQTLLHEIIHAVALTLELNLTERQVVGLAAGLHSVPQLRLTEDK